MYRLKRDFLGDFPRLTLEGKQNRVEILPSLGGCVQQISLAHQGSSVDLLVPDTVEQLAENPLYRGRLLFPFNDRIPEGKYSFAGEDFKLEINSPEENIAMHGFLDKASLSEVSFEETESHASLTLSHTLSGYTPGYPFKLAFQVEYKLEDAKLTMNFQIKNCDKKSAPVAFGWHPYYALSDFVQDMTLQMDSPKMLAVDADLLPTGDFLPCPPELDFHEGKKLSMSELDLAFEAPKDGVIFLRGGGKELKLTHDPEFFPYVQLYLPDDKKSLAIEPVTASTNSFNRPELGLRVLSENEKICGHVELCLNS